MTLLEAKMDEHSRGLAQLRESVVHLEERMDRRFDAIDRRSEGVDAKFESVNARFESVNARFDSLEASIDTKLGRLMAIQVTSLAGMLAALGAVVAAVLTR